MGRAPCCEKMGLKKGPWTPEEDRILIDYIQLYGHGNWRALPKHAGLLRCGKSCRLRWINYLRPDLKRGNFSREEEDTIIKLHEMLGNRWSAIAARLPGRTDNEIKNVWHTHLKKRLKQSGDHPTHGSGDISSDNTGSGEGAEDRPTSPHQYSSDISSATTSDTNNIHMKVEPSNDFPEVDENFWSEVLSSDNSTMESDLPEVGKDDLLHHVRACDSNLYDSMDFWHSIFTGAGELPEI